MNVVELAPGMPVGFRDRDPSNEKETGFIYTSWLRGHHQAGDWPRRMATPICAQRRAPPGVATIEGKACSCCRYTHRRYFDEHKKVIARLLERSRVLVACNPLNEGQILGYIVHEPGVLHWVMVKEPFRWDKDAEHHPRIGRQLFMLAFPDWAWPRDMDVRVTTSCTHWTMAAERLSEKWGLVYRPFLLEEQ